MNTQQTDKESSQFHKDMASLGIKVQVKDWTPDRIQRCIDQTKALDTQSPQTSHSPLPWHIEASASQMTWLCSGHKHIATIMDRDVNIDEDARIQSANAAFIVRACNNYPKLIAICKEIADSQCDLRDSERRIRLYAALESAGVL